MPNALAVTCGATAISLSSDGCILSRYVPAGGPNGATGEAVEFCIIGGTGAAAKNKLNAIERLLEQAIERASENRDERAYLRFQAIGDDTAWRSEITAYQVLLTPSMPVQLAQGLLAVRLILARGPWETVAELDAGTVHTTNGDAVGGPGIGDWVGPAAPPTYSAAFGADEGDNAYNAGEWTNILGVLPTPAHLRIINESGGSITPKRVFVANDVYARFDGAQHQLPSGSGVTWTGPSSHATARWTLTLTDAQVSKLVAGGGVRLLAVMTSVMAGVYLRAQLQQVAGAGTLPAWTGPEAWTESGKLVYDLGYMQMPPGVTTFTGWRIVVSIFATTDGSANLDFLQFCPGRDLVILEGPGVAWANGAAIDWWGDERYAVVGGLHASLRGRGQLLLQPQRPNRLMVLVEAASGVDVTVKMAMRVRYRPRRPTI